MMEYTIVMSESGDWYVIPLEKLEEWESETRYTFEGEESWVMYIGDPSAICFNDWRKI